MRLRRGDIDQASLGLETWANGSSILNSETVRLLILFSINFLNFHFIVKRLQFHS